MNRSNSLTKKYYKLIFVFLLLMLPLKAFADGGGPLLLFISLSVFSFGQIWILSSEYIYFVLLFKKVSKLKLLWWNILMNLVSTIAGIIFAYLLAIIGYASYLAIGAKNKVIASLMGYLVAMSTWVAGDNSPHAWLALCATLIGFIITFFITVYIEYWVIYRLQKKENIISKKNLLKHSYFWNLISYVGLLPFLLINYLAIQFNTWFSDPIHWIVHTALRISTW